MGKNIVIKGIFALFLYLFVTPMYIYASDILDNDDILSDPGYEEIIISDNSDKQEILDEYGSEDKGFSYQPLQRTEDYSFTQKYTNKPALPQPVSTGKVASIVVHRVSNYCIVFSDCFGGSFCWFFFSFYAFLDIFNLKHYFLKIKA